MTSEFADTLLTKVREDYDTIASSFSETRTAIWTEMRRFTDYVEHGAHVLDIGCGNGRAYQVFDGLAIAYEGIDVSVGLIGEAKKHVNDLMAEFRVGSIMALPYDDDEFELAIAVASIHHLPSDRYRRMAIREAWRTIKPGGHLIMLNWNRWLLEYKGEIADMLWRWITRSGYDFGDMLIPWKRGPEKLDRYYHAFRPHELRKLCEEVGFEVLENEMVQGGKNLMTICKKPEVEEVEIIEGMEGPML